MQCLPLSQAQTHKTCKSFKHVSPNDIEFVDAYSDFHRPHEISELNETYANKISHSVRSAEIKICYKLTIKLGVYKMTLPVLSILQATIN